MELCICDICGEQLDRVRDYQVTVREDQKYYAQNPKGIFVLEYKPLMVDEKEQPIGFGWRPFHMCRICSTRISHTLLEEIEKMQDSIHRPSAIIPVPKFDASPEKAVTTPLGCTSEPYG